MRTIVFTAMSSDDIVIVYYDEKFIIDSYDDLFAGIEHLAMQFEQLPQYDYVEVEIRY